MKEGELRCLCMYKTCVYVKHEIVHNNYVITKLRAKGVVFIEEIDEVPDKEYAPL